MPDIWDHKQVFSVRFSDHHSNTGPFDNRTQIYCLNTRLVRYSDSHCTYYTVILNFFLVLRDIEDRGRDLETILTQYTTLVKPAFEEFCLPVNYLLYSGQKIKNLPRDMHKRKENTVVLINWFISFKGNKAF